MQELKETAPLVSCLRNLFSLTGGGRNINFGLRFWGTKLEDCALGPADPKCVYLEILERKAMYKRTEIKFSYVHLDSKVFCVCERLRILIDAYMPSFST